MPNIWQEQEEWGKRRRANRASLEQARSVPSLFPSVGPPPTGDFPRSWLIPGGGLPDQESGGQPPTLDPQQMAARELVMKYLASLLPWGGEQLQQATPAVGPAPPTVTPPALPPVAPAPEMPSGQIPSVAPQPSGYYLYPEGGGMAVTPEGGKRLEAALYPEGLPYQETTMRFPEGGMATMPLEAAARMVTPTVPTRPEEGERLQKIAENPMLYMSRLELAMGQQGWDEAKRSRARQTFGGMLEQAGVDPGAIGAYVTGGAQGMADVGQALSKVKEAGLGREAAMQRQMYSQEASLDRMIYAAQFNAMSQKEKRSAIDLIMGRLSLRAKEANMMGYAIIDEQGKTYFQKRKGEKKILGLVTLRGDPVELWNKGELDPKQFFTFDVRTMTPYSGYGPTKPSGGRVIAPPVQRPNIASVAQGPMTNFPMPGVATGAETGVSAEEARISGVVNNAEKIIKRAQTGK